MLLQPVSAFLQLRDEGAGMDPVGIGLHYEDLPIGKTYSTFGRTITEADITNFVNCVGMNESLFLDEEFRKAEFGSARRFAPGALTYSIAEALLVPSGERTGLAFLGMTLNIEAPVYAGDTIHVQCSVTEARRSKSRADRGIVRTRNEVVNQAGLVVMVYTPLRMIKVRNPTNTADQSVIG
jgi:acyl dehydratase